MSRYLNNDSHLGTSDFADAYNRGDLRTALKALEEMVADSVRRMCEMYDTDLKG